MKSTILLIILLVVSCGLFANPAIFPRFSELWFNSDGHCMLEIPYEGNIPKHYIVLSDGENYVELDDSLQFALQCTDYDSTVVFDLTEELPQLHFTPENGTLQWCSEPGDTDNPYNVYYAVTWGNSTDNDVSPLLSGQSINCLTYIAGAFGEPFYYLVCKSAPPTPGTSPFTATQTSLLKIECKDQYGQPVPYVLINNWYKNHYDAITGSDGIYQVTTYAQKVNILIKHPQTGDTLYYETKFLEPNEETYIPVTIELLDNQPFIPALPESFYLRVEPNPVNFRNHNIVSFYLDIKDKAPKAIRLKIYNFKGQYITELVTFDRNRFIWKPDKDISSGKYIARLVSANRVLDAVRFTILK